MGKGAKTGKGCKGKQAKTGKGCKEQAKRGKGCKGKQAKRGKGCKGKAKKKLHGPKAKKLMESLNSQMLSNEFKRQFFCNACWERWQAILWCDDLFGCDAERFLNGGVLMLCGTRYACKDM
jgi:hypothetical protein